ncbi:MAG TPA: GTPase HflX [Ktedonobacterales bacterium]
MSQPHRSLDRLPLECDTAAIETPVHADPRRYSSGQVLVSGGANTSKNPRLIDLRPEASAEKAFLAGVELNDSESLWSSEDSLEELAALARTAGAEVVGSMIQRLRAPDSRYYLGKGRTAELSQLQQELGFDLLIFDDELSPSQQRNLEREINARVIDRTALILDIFAQHAHTREGKLQVELAQLEYRLPRLSGRGTALSRVGGGSRSAGAGSAGGAIGVRGPGETKLEIDRRRIRKRISDLRHELEGVRRQRTHQRRERSEQAMPVVSIVGYTNAGKSTLFNTLTQAGVLVENKLFATLDPTMRHLVLPSHQEILLSDTVGFIQKLPTDLVASFRATLEEVSEADLLLEVVDISHENAIEQSETVNEVLAELGAQDKPRVTALNKIDLVDDPAEIDLSLFPNAVPVSALKDQGLDALLQKVGEIAAAEMKPVCVRIPYDASDMVELFHRRGRVLREKHTDDGTEIEGSLPQALHPLFERFQAPQHR